MNEFQNQNTPLIVASRHGHVVVMKKLLDAGAKLSLVNSVSLHFVFSSEQCFFVSPFGQMI